MAAVNRELDLEAKIWREDLFLVALFEKNSLDRFLRPFPPN